MLAVRMVLGPGIGGAVYSNVLQERQQHYVTRYTQNVDMMNPEAATTFIGTMQNMQNEGKSETEAQNMASISIKGRIQKQATLSAVKEMAGWTFYGCLLCMIFVLIVPYPKRKIVT
jgi:pyridoxine/pyridoxamine 5'-phosphate oxidase